MNLIDLQTLDRRKLFASKNQIVMSMYVRSVCLYRIIDAGLFNCRHRRQLQRVHTPVLYLGSWAPIGIFPRMGRG